MSGPPDDGEVVDLGENVQFDTTKIATIEERSDIDPHENLDKNKLGEDWGDGFFVQEEPVMVLRDARGVIRRTVPLDEVPGLERQGEPLSEDEIHVGEPIETPVPLNRMERYKLVGILAKRLVDYYKGRVGIPDSWNPYRDGLPKNLMSGSVEHLQPLPGTQLYPATDGEIFDFFKRVVGDRVKVIEKNKGYGDWRDYSLRIDRS